MILPKTGSLNAENQAPPRIAETNTLRLACATFAMVGLAGWLVRPVRTWNWSRKATLGPAIRPAIRAAALPVCETAPLAKAWSIRFSIKRMEASGFGPRTCIRPISRLITSTWPIVNVNTSASPKRPWWSSQALASRNTRKRLSWRRLMMPGRAKPPGLKSIRPSETMLS